MGGCPLDQAVFAFDSFRLEVRAVAAEEVPPATGLDIEVPVEGAAGDSSDVRWRV